MSFDLRKDENSVEVVRDKALAYLKARDAEKLIEPEVIEEKPRFPRSPLRGDDWTFLYLIHSNGCVKIGRATNLRIRVSNLWVDNPHGIEVVAYWELPRLVVKHLDSLLLQMFDPWCVRGDWHAIPVEEAKAAVEAMVMLVHGLPSALKAPRVK